MARFVIYNIIYIHIYRVALVNAMKLLILFLNFTTEKITNPHTIRKILFCLTFDFFNNTFLIFVKIFFSI